MPPADATSPPEPGQRRLAPRIRARLHELYFGKSERSVRFRLTVIAIDFVMIAFFIAAPLLRDTPAFLFIDATQSNLQLPGLCGTVYALPTIQVPIGVADGTGALPPFYISRIPFSQATVGLTLYSQAAAIDVGDVLQRVLAMPITRWRYRNDTAAWHLGPVAEDFHAAFGLGESEQYIGTVDADGVALAAIQGLAARSEARASALQQENAQLRATLDALAARVAALEQER